jgi:hypothetical protein
MSVELPTMSVHWCGICNIQILACSPGLVVGEVLPSKNRNRKSVLLSCELNSGQNFNSLAATAAAAVVVVVVVVVVATAAAAVAVLLTHRIP